MLRNKLIYVFIALFFSVFAIAQETALPFITNYGHNNAGIAEVWTAVRDSRGIMYFATNGGIVEYDGKNWTAHTLKEGFLVRALAVDVNGRIYYGASGDFGYFEIDSSGGWRPVSLFKQLDTSFFSQAPAVWRVHINNGLVYFNALTAIIVYDPDAKDKPFDIIRPEEKFFFSFEVGNKIIINDFLHGLVMVQGDTVVQVPGAEILKNNFVLSVVPYSEKDDVWLVALWNKLYLFKPGFDNTGKSWFVPFETDAQYLFDKYSIYTVLALPHGRFAIGTGTHGVVVIAHDGKLLEFYDKDRGLISNTTISLAYFNNNLWVTSYKGISKVELDIPIRFYDDRTNVNGVVLDTKIAGGALYCGTDEGFLVLDNYAKPDFLHPAKFFKVNTKYYETFAIEPYYDSITNTRYVVVGQSNGLSVYNAKTKNVKLIKSDINVYTLEQSDVNPDIIFAGSENLLLVLKRAYSTNLWTFDTISGFSGHVRRITQDGNDLYLSTFYDGIVVINNVLDSVKRKVNDNYTVKKYFVFGRDTILKDVYVFKALGRLYATTPKGLFVYDNASDSFVKSGFGHGMFDDYANWFFENDQGEIFTYKGIIRRDGHVDSTLLKRVALQIQNITYNYPKWYISTMGGIVVYDDSAARYFADTCAFYAVIRSVRTKDSVVFRGNFVNEDGHLSLSQDSENIPVFKYKENSVVFSFAAPYFIEEDSIYFVYKLDGFDKDWSVPTLLNTKEYTNLPEGKYTFRVKAINIFGRTSREAVFAFEIRPPWYRTLWAYLIYFVLVVVIVYVIVKLNTRRLEQAKIKLEKIVEERTAEINMQKEELRTQAENLQRANEEITKQKEEIEKAHRHIRESIHYASRIQSAVIPGTELLDKYFSGYFIFYRPRDIVSGDFYWIKEVSDYVVIAVADCTGHGVPGAFVSMLGIAFLNEIVRKAEVKSAADILEHLRKQVKTSLNQTGKNDESKDGMDIAVAVIEKQTLMLQFSGANNPAFVIRAGELIELKPVRNPVSIFIKEKPFVNVDFQLFKGDMLYMFSDGFPDQFDKTQSRKFYMKNFKLLLKSLSVLDVEQQYNKLRESFDDWKGDANQTDDVLVIGIKI